MFFCDPKKKSQVDFLLFFFLILHKKCTIYLLFPGKGGGMLFFSCVSKNGVFCVSNKLCVFCIKKAVCVYFFFSRVIFSRYTFVFLFPTPSLYLFFSFPTHFGFLGLFYEARKRWGNTIFVVKLRGVLFKSISF